jgi:hypothetical protein
MPHTSLTHRFGLLALAGALALSSATSRTQTPSGITPAGRRIHPQIQAPLSLKMSLQDRNKFLASQNLKVTSATDDIVLSPRQPVDGDRAHLDFQGVTGSELEKNRFWIGPISPMNQGSSMVVIYFKPLAVGKPHLVIFDIYGEAGTATVISQGLITTLQLATGVSVQPCLVITPTNANTTYAAISTAASNGPSICFRQVSVQLVK